MKIVLIGSGNVATHLGIALQKSGHKILQVFGRTDSHTLKLSKKLGAEYTTEIEKIKANAEIYLIALSDEAITKIIPFIPNKKALVIHTSGSVPIEVFPKDFENPGVIYPLQTFSIPRKVNMQTVPLCLEIRNPKSKNKVLKIAKSLSTNIHWINSEKRRALHLAAVFANNFSNHMFVLAEEILKINALDFDLLRPLILETSSKVQKNSPSAMQTGPAKRGDSETIEKHLKLLIKKPEYAKLYSLISKSIEDHSGPLL